MEIHISIDINFYSMSQEKSRRMRKKQRREEKRSSRKFISQEVLEDILVRLPAKSLCRFKSVSKTWRRLIESRLFIDFYRLRHSRDYSSNTLVHMPLEVPEIRAMVSLECPANVNKREEWSRVVHAMGPLRNGIYCLVSFLDCAQRVSVLTGKILVWNPFTSEYKFANPFSYHEDDELYSLLTDLVNRQCRVHYGFGTGKDGGYKVVVLISWGSLFSSFLTFVYNFKSGGWRKLVDYERGKRNYRDRDATDGLIIKGEEEVRYNEITPDLELCPQRFYKGCWHWMTVSEDGTCFVMSFNVDDEAFSLMSAPSSVSFNADNLLENRADAHYLTCTWVLVLNEHLGAIIFPNPCSIIQVWMMMKYGVGKSWRNIYAIEPNYHGHVSRLIAINWKNEDDENGRKDGNAIKSIHLVDCRQNQVVYFDESGFQELGNSDVYNISSNVWLNTVGISTAMVSLEPV